MTLVGATVVSLVGRAPLCAHAVLAAAAASAGVGAAGADEERQMVSVPPRQKHWHGATATTGMSHVAIQEQQDGKSAEWFEKVGDEQYRAGSSAE